MSVELLNFIETVLNGLMSGIMYSLVALGFVLIFKASGVFNFAQGVFALFAIIIVIASKGHLTFLADLYNFGAMLAFFMTHLSLIILRIKKPKANRPFKVPFNVSFNVPFKVPFRVPFEALFKGAS